MFEFTLTRFTHVLLARRSIHLCMYPSLPFMTHELIVSSRSPADKQKVRTVEIECICHSCKHVRLGSTQSLAVSRLA